MTVEDIKKCVNAYDAYTKKGKLVKMLRGAQWRESFTRYIELLTTRKTELDSAFTQQTLFTITTLQARSVTDVFRWYLSC